MLSCYVASTRLLISRTVIDAPFNYSSIRIDILHFPRRVEQGTWLLRPRRMTFLMLWRANNGGKSEGVRSVEREKDQEKRQKSKSHFSNQNEQFSIKMNNSHSNLHILKQNDRQDDLFDVVARQYLGGKRVCAFC